MRILGTLSALDQGATIVMHEVDAKQFGGDVFRFHDGLGTGVNELVWCGRRYTFWPVAIEDVRVEGDKPTRPRLRLGNHNGYVTKLCEQYQDLLGAVYTLRTTKGMFLDSANFEGWKGYALALEGQSTITGAAAAPAGSVLVELEAPRIAGEADATALSLGGGLQTSLVFRQGQLMLTAPGVSVDLGPAPPNAKFQVALYVRGEAGKASLSIQVNEQPITAVTTADYGLWQTITIGGGDNRGFRIRSLVLRHAEFSIADLRTHAQTGLVSGPVSNYRFSDGNVVDQVTSVPLKVNDSAVTYQEDYYYSLYGLSKYAMQRIDSIGNVYLVDWVKTNPNASIYEELPAEKFRIVRKASETPMEVVFELAPLYDVKGLKLPLKIVTENVCLHTYRDEYCRYAGPPRDINGDLITILPGATQSQIDALNLLDECSHDKKGCQARHGRVLPIGCFLGAGRVRR